MIKGLYIAASAMVTNIDRQSVLSHNLANINTPGFKQILLTTQEWDQTSVLHPPSEVTDIQNLGLMGLGVTTSDEITDYTEGAFRSTGTTFDFAINGAGFFTYEDEEGGVHYTRDGRFSLDAEGNLVTIEGNFVLDSNGNRINLPDGNVLVSNKGLIKVEDVEIANFGIAVFEDPETQLVRDMQNGFTALEDPTGEFTGSVRQGFLEITNVDIAQITTQMVSVTRAYEAAQTLVQIQDELLAKTISSLGRF